MKSKKITYVVDTNVFLTDYESLEKFGANDIVIPLKVLEEIDKHKKRQDGVGLNARHFIRMLDELREKSQKSGANLQKGIRIGKNKGLVRVVSPKEEDLDLLPIILDKTHPDNNIICVALIEKEKAKDDDSVILVSLDVNMRVKCDSCGIASETYTENQVVKRAKDIYTGFSSYLVADSDVDDFYAGEDIFVEKTEDTKNFKPNQYVVLTSTINEKKTALAFFKSFDKPLRRVKDYTINKDGKVFGLVAKNREQRMLLDLLMNNDVPVVTILGSAGCGKSLLAIAASLELVLGEDSKYEKLLVSRPVVPMGRDIGFLPGPQPLDAKILTPAGWTTMGELKVGDFVIGGNGKPVEVLKIMPKGKKKIVKFYTLDGGEVESCEDHIWSTKTYEQKKRKKDYTLKTTKQIIETFLTKKGKPNHYLPRVTSPVIYDAQPNALPIPPYTFGVLLGDGSFSDSISFSSKDNDLIKKVSREVKQLKCEVQRYQKDKITYSIACEKNLFHNSKTARQVILTNCGNGEEKVIPSIGEAVKELGYNRNLIYKLCTKNKCLDGYQFSWRTVKKYQNPIKEEVYKMGLLGKRAWKKSIPEIYMRASVEDRIELLRGLMDTDGTIKKNGEASYTTTSLQLAKDIKELVDSLGGRAKLCSRNRIGKSSHNNVDGRAIISKRISYEFNICLPENINPFYMERKASRHKCSYMHYNAIQSFEYLPEKEVQCIHVNSEDGLYVTNDFTITHNSRDEKMRPWLSPIEDNLEFLLSRKENKRVGENFEALTEKGIIQIEALTYIRGRSIANSIMIIDEAQNLTPHEVKTILTRVGDGTKIILTGDIEQIDNTYINESTNGLTYAIEKLKDSELTGHITLQKGERSKVAALCAQVL